MSVTSIEPEKTVNKYIYSNKCFKEASYPSVWFIKKAWSDWGEIAREILQSPEWKAFFISYNVLRIGEILEPHEIASAEIKGIQLDVTYTAIF